MLYLTLKKIISMRLFVDIIGQIHAPKQKKDFTRHHYFQITGSLAKPVQS